MSRTSDYVQYGCGLCAPHTWRNFDASPTLQLQRLPLVGAFLKRGPYPIFPDNVEHGDIVKGLPISNGQCSAVYCSHILEHLALYDFRIALKNTCRYLKVGGIFRLVLPDLEQLARTYIESTEPNAALLFMDQSYLGKKVRTRGIGGLMRDWLGNSAHFWMWDLKSIIIELQQAGFGNIRRAEFGDSAEPRFKDVEEIGRWEHCLGVECVKV